MLSAGGRKRTIQTERPDAAVVAGVEEQKIFDLSCWDLLEMLILQAATDFQQRSRQKDIGNTCMPLLLCKKSQLASTERQGDAGGSWPNWECGNLSSNFPLSHKVHWVTGQLLALTPAYLIGSL